MTDRHAGYVVTLDRDIRADEAACIMDALLMLKGVISVQPVVADVPLAIATERTRVEMRDKLYEIAGGL